MRKITRVQGKHGFLLAPNANKHIYPATKTPHIYQTVGNRCASTEKSRFVLESWFRSFFSIWISKTCLFACRGETGEASLVCRWLHLANIAEIVVYARSMKATLGQLPSSHVWTQCRMVAFTLVYRCTNVSRCTCRDTVTHRAHDELLIIRKVNLQDRFRGQETSNIWSIRESSLR